MGSTTSKLSRKSLNQDHLSLDTRGCYLRPYQVKSIADDCFGVKYVIRRSRSWSGLCSIKDDRKSKFFDEINLLPSIPQTPTETPPCEPEMTQEINTGELMEGLDDFTLINTWEFVDPSESMFAYLEPTISSPTQNTSDEILPQLNSNNKIEVSSLSSKCCESPKILGIVQARINSFERIIEKRRMQRESNLFNYYLDEKKKVVFYFTSLTGIPSTYEDCQVAKEILQGYGVCLDERDVSMDAGFKKELNELLGFSAKLPRIFVDGFYIGGVEELRNMHTSGELVYLLDGCEMKAVGDDGNFMLCPGCADVRFVPCLSCSGSCRVFLETTDRGESNSVEFQKCTDCNENGLVLCPVCW
ncbi:hypothetical protein LUZ62_080457 [Rhynchospora pubera]|uniref:Glutaredoxin domain-containing protein n=1 Tax=Rhynchospora pubera TaxID=906938 RepID=A0AAV8BU84_9POAL|nr:hypothetical protein LUZ62_080457 [Rhynchospora pubera]